MAMDRMLPRDGISNLPVDDQAMAKVDVPLLAAHFIDFLGLLKEDGTWKIVNKMYTTI